MLPSPDAPVAPTDLGPDDEVTSYRIDLTAASGCAFTVELRAR